MLAISKQTSNTLNVDINVSSIRKIVSLRLSQVPVRIYDVSSGCFVTRRDLSRTIEEQVIEDYANQKFEASLQTVDSDGVKFQLDQERITNLVKESTRFAILSHRWSSTELTYQDGITTEGARRLRDHEKFKGLCEAAQVYGCQYVWMDSVCIDHSKSTEVDESIRSMYTWYRTAYVCFVYLEQFSWDTHRSDEWFYRGWTLQELLAPARIVFFGKKWERAFPGRENYPFDIERPARSGAAPSKQAVTKLFNGYSKPNITPDEWVAGLTGISLEDMLSYKPSSKHARKIFTYMQNRTTSVLEDAAYCLVGLLDILLPIAYGEGVERALYRLQVACAEQSDERNIFLWDYTCNNPSSFNSMLASNPFETILENVSLLGDAPSQMVSIQAEQLWDNIWNTRTLHGYVDHTFAFTNGGLRISLILHDILNKVEDKFYSQCAPDHGIRISGARRTKWRGNLVYIKLAILGTYTDGKGEVYAFPIMLEKLGKSRIPKYRRIPCAIVGSTLPPLKTLLSRAPEGVYIV
ncbi:hypothetical protein ONZ45_g12992 [Pleurotus djamor]|nr:hypothetical protein ONZ45_g12992 [Pleurotus djamor]